MSSSLWPSATGPSRLLMPYSVTMRLAIWVARSMSFSAPVVISE